jgi:hypothetical protein
MTDFSEEIKDALKYNRDILFMSAIGTSALFQIKSAADRILKRYMILESRSIEGELFAGCNSRIAAVSSHDTPIIIFDVHHTVDVSHLIQLKEILQEAKNRQFQVALKMVGTNTQSSLGFYKDNELINSLEQKYNEANYYYKSPL